MSTRGLMGIRKKGQLKAQYNHYDSYISGLGKDIIDAINEIPKNERISVLNKTYDNIILLDSDTKPTKKIIDYCKANNVCDFNVSSRSENDLYCLLRKTQGNLKLYLNGFKYMVNDNDFIEDSLFCEYAYVIDLDKNKLEITCGYSDRKTRSFDLLDLQYNEIEQICEEEEV